MPPTRAGGIRPFVLAGLALLLGALCLVAGIAGNAARTGLVDALSARGTRVTATVGAAYRPLKRPSRGAAFEGPWVFPVSFDLAGPRTGALACGGECPAAGTTVRLWVDPDDPSVFADERGVIAEDAGGSGIGPGVWIAVGLVLLTGGGLAVPLTVIRLRGRPPARRTGRRARREDR